MVHSLDWTPLSRDSGTEIGRDVKVGNRFGELECGSKRDNIPRYALTQRVS